MDQDPQADVSKTHEWRLAMRWYRLASCLRAMLLVLFFGSVGFFGVFVLLRSLGSPDDFPYFLFAPLVFVPLWIVMLIGLLLVSIWRDSMGKRLRTLVEGTPAPAQEDRYDY